MISPVSPSMMSTVERSADRPRATRSVTWNGPPTAISWVWRHRLGFTVAGASWSSTKLYLDRHCCIKRLRDHEAVNLPADVHSAAVTRARKGPDRVSGCHGAGADERFSCRMIMRSFDATVPLPRLIFRSDSR